MKDHSSAVAVGFATILALGIRLLVIMPAPFPLNDGGLFYTFIHDILQSGYRLPVWSTYNGGTIPFAYPPLAFYLMAFLHQLSEVPITELMKDVPGLLSVAAIPAFYRLAVPILGSRRQAALATLVFSLVPRAFEWLIMGGGTTRALGLVLALLTMQEGLRFFDSNATRGPARLVVLCGLLVMTHPEAALHTVLTLVVLYVWRDRTSTGLRRSAIVAGGVLLITAPWWAVVVWRHGISPFLSVALAARADSYTTVAAFFAVVRFEFTDEPFLAIFAVLGLLGLAVKGARGSYALPAWLAVMHFVEPRGAGLFLMLPMAMAAGFFLDEIVLPAFGARNPGALSEGRFSHATAPPWLPRLLNQRWPRIGLAFLLVYGCLGAYSVGQEIRRDFSLSLRDLGAVQWVRANTTPESTFALVTGELPLRDALSDWFPALTGRRSTATAFGLEWTHGPTFSVVTGRYEELQRCLGQDDQCLLDWAAEHRVRYDYLLVRSADPEQSSALNESLKHSAGFELAYSDAGLAIYERR